MFGLEHGFVLYSRLMSGMQDFTSSGHLVTLDKERREKLDQHNSSI